MPLFTSPSAKRLTRRVGLLLGGAGVAAAAATLAAMAAGIPLASIVSQVPRAVAVSALSLVYQRDRADVVQLVGQYQHGTQSLTASPDDAWRTFAAEPGPLRVDLVETAIGAAVPVPFVYERADAVHLTTLRQRERLDEVIAGAADEYEAMLQLAGWLGRQFDHGVDQADARQRYVCDPTGLLTDGRRGDKFWCEMAAVTMVNTATAVGWPARLVALSMDGYQWQHGVAEVWSNTFRKWYVVDVDYNVVYEDRGVPLSAAELAHGGDRLFASTGFRIRPIAPPKPSIPDPSARATLPLYRYVNIDMRNDWCTRQLRRGSPAGGDLATWWTAPADVGPLVTMRHRVSSPDELNWPVNVTQLFPVRATQTAGALALEFDLAAYAPHFTGFEISLDGAPWQVLTTSRGRVVLEPGAHEVRARVSTKSGYGGPPATLRLAVK